MTEEATPETVSKPLLVEPEKPTSWMITVLLMLLVVGGAATVLNNSGSTNQPHPPLFTQRTDVPPQHSSASNTAR